MAGRNPLVDRFLAAVQQHVGGSNDPGSGSAGLPWWTQGSVGGGVSGSGAAGLINQGTGAGATQRQPNAPAGRQLNAEQQAEQDWAGVMRLRAGRDPQVVEISDEDYATLSPEQQAAVDYNTAYYRAVEADLALQDAGTEPDDTQRETYTELLNSTFGERAGEAYAPNTVAFLNALGTTDVGTTVEDYLALRGGILGTEIDALGGEGSTPRYGYALAKPSEFRLEQVDEALRRSQALIEQLRPTTDGPTALDSFVGTRFSDQVNRHISTMGLGIGETIDAETLAAETDQVMSRLGGGGGEPQPAPESEIESLFNYTIDRANAGTWTADQLYSSLVEKGYDPNEYARYVDARLRKYDEAVAGGFNVYLGRTPDGNYLSSQEYRTLIGLTAG